MKASPMYYRWFVPLKLRYRQIIHLTMNIYQSKVCLPCAQLPHSYCLARTVAQLSRIG